MAFEINGDFDIEEKKDNEQELIAYKRKRMEWESICIERAHQLDKLQREEKIEIAKIRAKYAARRQQIANEYNQYIEEAKENMIDAASKTGQPFCEYCHEVGIQIESCYDCKLKACCNCRIACSAKDCPNFTCISCQQISQLLDNVVANDELCTHCQEMIISIVDVVK